MKLPSGWQKPRAASGPSSRSRLSPTSVLEMPTARPARRYDSPSSRTAATASRRTSNASGGVPPWPGGRGGARWARRAASQASTCAGSEERGQYDKGTRPPGGRETPCPWSGPRQRPAAQAITDTLTTMAVLAVIVAPAVEARDRPFSTARRVVRPVVDPLDSGATTGGGGQFSKVQIERYRCAAAAGSAYGTPSGAMDISCNDAQPYRQDFNPDNELAIAVNPKVPGALLAGSNDYFYRFNNSTGVRQALVPTGFFTSFDGGQTWVDGQIPMRSGNGAGDPSPAFNGKLSGATAQTGWAMMAQLENVGGQGGPWVSQGNVTVSWSADGGITWSEPVTAMKGRGAGIGPANNALFFDKEWLTVDHYPSSPHYGRA